VEEDELTVAKALNLCDVANKKPRKEQTADEETCGGEMGTKFGTYI